MTAEELYKAKERIINSINNNEFGDDVHFPGLKEQLIKKAEEAYENEISKLK